MDEENQKDLTNYNGVLGFVKRFAVHHIAGTVFASIFHASLYAKHFFLGSSFEDFEHRRYLSRIQNYVWPFNEGLFGFIAVFFLVSIPALLVISIFRKSSLRKRLLYNFIFIVLFQLVGGFLARYTIVSSREGIISPPLGLSSF
jgi:formate-dependent nitrite reductase membrane component NrfD